MVILEFDKTFQITGIILSIGDIIRRVKTLRIEIYPGTKLLWNKGVELLKFKVIVRGHTIYGGE